MSFWGSATEGFNQGLAESMRRAAEKRQRDFAIQTRDEERKYQATIAQQARINDLRDEERLFNQNNPWTTMPTDFDVPTMDMPVPTLFGARTIKVPNPEEQITFTGGERQDSALFRMKQEEHKKNMEAPDWSTADGSYQMPDDPEWSKYPSWKNPVDGMTYRSVPRPVVDAKNTPLRTGGGGQDDVRYERSIPVDAKALPGNLLTAYGPRIKDGVVMVSPLELSVITPYLQAKAQATEFVNEQDTLKARGALWSLESEDGKPTPGLIPADITKMLLGTTQGSRLEAAYADALKRNVGQMAAVEEAYRAIDLKQAFPELTVIGGQVQYKPEGIFNDKSYKPTEFARFKRDFKVGDESLKKALWDALWGQTAPPAATPTAAPVGEDPEDAYLRAAGIKL